MGLKFAVGIVITPPTKGNALLHAVPAGQVVLGQTVELGEPITENGIGLVLRGEVRGAPRPFAVKIPFRSSGVGTRCVPLSWGTPFSKP